MPITDRSMSAMSPAQHIGGFDHLVETLGKHRIERDFPQVMQQAADKRLGRHRLLAR